MIKYSSFKLWIGEYLKFLNLLKGHSGGMCWFLIFESIFLSKTLLYNK